MTRRTHAVLIGAALSLTGRAAVAQSQSVPCPGPGNPAGYGQYQNHFDPKTVQTIEGTVTAVEKTASRGAWPGLHLRVKTASETVEVHLGPAWFVDSGEVAFAAGHKVQVKGSRVKLQGKPFLIAMTVTRGEMTLRLRDADGFPFWAGWRRRGTAPGPGPGRGRPR